MLTDDCSLSAKVAADRVAERRGVRQQPANPEIPYVCENCLSRQFVFYRTRDEQRTLRQSLDCRCGEHEFAASRECVETRTVTEGGRLGEDHRAAWGTGWDEEEIETVVESEDREEAASEVECPQCLKDAESGDWETELTDGWEVAGTWESCELRCAACGHEIEFGYSHAEGGRIWPCESTDFNPWKCFPEDRFLEDWKRRGWLRPRRESGR